MLPDKAALYLTAIEDADYKEDKIECELISLLYSSYANAELVLYLLYLNTCVYSSSFN